MATFNLIADVAFLAEMAGDSERVDLLKKVNTTSQKRWVFMRALRL